MTKLRQDTDGAITNVVLVEPKEAINKIGRDVFSALLKCCVGADQVITLDRALQHALKIEDPVERNRDCRVLMFSLASSLLELGRAICTLGRKNLYGKLTNRDAWLKLSAIGKELEESQEFITIRNEVGHHLGKPQRYLDGLETLAAEAEIVMMRSDGDGTHLHNIEFPAAWETLMVGVGFAVEKQPGEYGIAPAYEQAIGTMVLKAREVPLLLTEVVGAALNCVGVRSVPGTTT